jgi:phosphinothricin acetyltransferase
MSNIRAYKEKDQNQVIKLFYQLTGKSVIFESDEIIADKNCHAIIIENENNITIGFASLVIFRTPVHGLVGRIEDLIVDEEYRGSGYGKLLMQELLKIAKTEKITQIELTSSAKRVVARGLYKSLGFELRETGVFLLKL